MTSIKEIFGELKKFLPSLVSFAEGAGEERIRQFEELYNVILPADYKEFIKITNGFDLMGVTIFGIYDEPVATSLNKVYQTEHFEVGNEMPKNLIPFSPDGGGNHYCFDSNACNAVSCKIIFWQHDLIYTENDPPEEVNDSFSDWTKEVVIGWTLEEYDYNGNKRN